MSLVPFITKIAVDSGCLDRSRCASVLEEANAKRGSLVEAVLEDDRCPWQNRSAVEDADVNNGNRSPEPIG